MSQCRQIRLKTPVGEVDESEMDDVSRPEVGQLRERLFIEHGRRLPNLADNSSRVRPPIAAREPLRRTAQGLESRADVDQRVRGRLASRQGHREGANRPGLNDIFGLCNFRPRRPAINGRVHIHSMLIGDATAHRRTNFIDVFWRVICCPECMLSIVAAVNRN